MDNVPVEGFDDVDPDCLAGLTCHIEMDVTGGLTPRDVAIRTAQMLRKTAELIAIGALDTGFHRVAGDDGVPVGEVYLDFYGESAD